MRAIFFSVLFGFTVVCAGTAQAAPPLVPAPAVSAAWMVPVGFKCGLVDGKLVCGNKQGGNNKQDDDDDRPKKSKDKVIPKTCGKKVNCEPGFVRLEKPNKYGACCEAREGLPPPKTAEPEKCKFPGEVGTPPNCSCPPGTEFMGYKGCVKKVVQRVCCTGIHGNSGGTTKGCKDTEAEARQDVSEALINGVPVTSITCAPEK